MKNLTLLCFLVIAMSTACEHVSVKQDVQTDTVGELPENLLTDYEAISKKGIVNAAIEIPAGTLEKWEVNKSTGQLDLEEIDGKPRIINYLGYPANYGMIPRTLLPKEQGGDGDPLDVLVLGPAMEKGIVVQCKVIAVLYLLDSGEQDDKLIAVSMNSPMKSINSIEELDSNYNGASEIIKLWFENYKGPGKMESKGFGSREEAIKILNTSITEYEAMADSRLRSN